MRRVPLRETRSRPVSGRVMPTAAGLGFTQCSEWRDEGRRPRKKSCLFVFAFLLFILRLPFEEEPVLCERVAGRKDLTRRGVDDLR